MVRTEVQTDTDVYYRVTCQRTRLQLLLDAFINGRDVFARNHTTFDVVDELVTFRVRARLQRVHVDHNVTVLTATTRLLSMFTFNVGNFAANRFAVSNLRFTYVSFNVELTLHTVNDDVEVQLTHTSDDGLVRFFVSPYAERRVFFSQTAQSQTHFFLVSFGFRFNRDRDYRLRELHALQNDRVIRVTQSVTSGHVFQTDCRSDVARANFFDLFTFVSVHLYDTTETLTCGFHGVQDGITRVNHTRVHAEERQVTNERVGSDFERQCRERLFIASVTLSRSIFTVVQDTVDRRYVNRGWQVINYRIQHRLYAFVFERRTAGYQDDFVVQNALTQSFFDLFFSQFFTAQVFLHQLFRSFSSGFDQVLVPFVSQVLHVSRDIFVFEGYALVCIVPVDGFHFHQVNNTGETFFSTNRQLQRNRVRAQTGFDLTNNFQEVRAHAVHFVNERNTRNFVFVSLTPYGFRLRLNTTNCAVNHYRTVKDTHGTFYFDGEVNVPRGVDDVDTVRFILLSHTRPECGSRSGGNGNTTLLLLFHPVHSCGAVMNFTDFVVYTGVEQNTFGSSGFTGVDVRTDTDVTVACNRCCTSHLIPLLP
ncbi:hypothetical protein BN130_2534 [Cronobacter malonaticus 507]|nr:hypothetical protein BN130_2534 [Cronobacter malonaticus 507]